MEIGTPGPWIWCTVMGKKEESEAKPPKEEDMAMGSISSHCSPRYKKIIRNMTAKEAWTALAKAAKGNLSALHAQLRFEYEHISWEACDNVDSCKQI